MLKLLNTLTKQKEEFQPLVSGKAGMYSCGPTVYGTPHIGNLRAYLFSDTLRRSLEFLGYDVTQVVNITDVGHLTSDGDAGEDKMEKGAAREGKTVWEVARGYEEEFIQALAKLNIRTPHHLPRATEHIEEQVEIIEKLADKGMTYQTSDGIYFDTQKFPDYGKLSGQKLDEKEAGARVEVNSEKKHPADFALWKFCVGENANHIMRWQNPCGLDGEGFPGWHVECSAMSKKYLGETFDIHTGGIDHIPVHHENEIAQSECAHGHTYVNYWLHCDFMTVDGGKMSKSLGNVYTLADVEARGFEPAAFRLLVLGSHYRSKVNFTWEALEAAQKRLARLRTDFAKLSTEAQPADDELLANFTAAIEDDLNTPQALATLESALGTGSRDLVEKLDAVLGLQLEKSVEEETIELTPEQETLLAERENARAEKDWTRSDEIRDAFAADGLEIEDTAEGQVVKKK